VGRVSILAGDGSPSAEVPGLDVLICQLESTDCLERYPLGFPGRLHVFWVPAGITEGSAYSCTRDEVFDMLDKPR